MLSGILGNTVAKMWSVKAPTPEEALERIQELATTMETVDSSKQVLKQTFVGDTRTGKRIE